MSKALLHFLKAILVPFFCAYAGGFLQELREIRSQFLDVSVLKLHLQQQHQVNFARPVYAVQSVGGDTIQRASVGKRSVCCARGATRGAYSHHPQRHRRRGFHTVHFYNYTCSTLGGWAPVNNGGRFTRSFCATCR